MVEQVDKAGKLALAQYKERVKAFMLARHYAKSSVTLFLQAGLLPKLVQVTLRNFQLLLEFLRTLTYKQGFDTGPAKHLLSIHSENLGEKRFYAHDYRGMILGTYICLREAYNKSFANEKLLTAVWDHIYRPPVPSETPSPATTTTPKPACSHCKTKTLHEGGKSLCVLKELPTVKAKAVAREILSTLKADSSLDRSKTIAEALKKAKDS